MRIIVWFSCGAASAVAAKETLRIYGAKHEVLIACCDTRNSEHPDNYRFSADVECWLEHPIIYLKSTKFLDVNDVVEKTRYMSGPRGARCTTELKKNVRKAFQLPDDRHVFGFTANEGKRKREFESRNPELFLLWPLSELGITKLDCYNIIKAAGIELPAMYKLGFNNNNCPGCLKGASKWYWDRVRTHFPEIFKQRCIQSRLLNVRLVEWTHHARIFLDELPVGPFRGKENPETEKMSCGPECGNANTP